MSLRTAPSHRTDWRIAWILVAPALVGFAIFAVYPTLRGVYLSFTSYDVLTAPIWTGFTNFIKLSRDSVFWSSLLTTVYFVVLSVALGIVISMGIAIVLQRLGSSTFLRGLLIVPFLISGVVAASVWSWLLDPQLGIVNILIKGAFGHSISFLGDSGWVIPSVAVISVWKSMGYYAIIIFAGLQTVPAPLYEAARVDGASEWRMFRSITLPLLRPILALVLVLNVIGAFQVFDIIQVTTKGGPANASNVLQMYIYNNAFGEFHFGYASAMSLALFAILIIVTFIQLRLLRANQSDMD